MRWRACIAGTGLAVLLTGCGGAADTDAPEAGGEAQQTQDSGQTDAQTNGEQTDQPEQAEADVVTERLDVTYADDDVEQHSLDLFLPENAGPGPFPVVVWVHGGGWAAGDKSDIGRDEISMDQVKNLILDNGYAIAAPNYRLIPDTVFPEPMQDVSAAVRYLRANAGDLGVDDERMALMGDSAGAHLAAMSAMSADDTELQGDIGETGVDNHVRAFVGYYGLYDLRTRTADQQEVCGGARPGAESSHGRLIGTDPDTPEGQEVAATASPAAYVSESSPATLLFQGREDCTAPYVQAENFGQALEEAGVPVEVTIIDKAHADPQFFTDPGLQQQLLDFLDSHLRG